MTLEVPEGAAAVKMNAGDSNLAVLEVQESFTMPCLMAMVTAVGSAFILMIDVLFVSNNNAGRPQQQPTTSQPPGFRLSSRQIEQQADLPQQQQLLLSLLPLVLGVVFELQQLAQHLQDDMQQPQPEGDMKYSDVCQQSAKGFMENICTQLTLAALSEQQQPQQWHQQLLQVAAAAVPWTPRGSCAGI